MDRWTRRRVIVVNEFSGFPKEIAGIVADYCMIPMLLPWINECKLVNYMLDQNPKIFESGMRKFEDVEAYDLFENPGAAEYIKSKFTPDVIGYLGLSNPKLFEWLIEHFGFDIETNIKTFMRQFDIYSYSVERICRNPHPLAVSLITKWHKYHEYSIPDGSNPGAIDFIESHMSEFGSEFINGGLWSNPAAIERGLIDLDNIEEDTQHYLSGNPHPRAIEFLKNNQDHIDWEQFSANPGIFEYRRDPKLMAAISE